jgi:hypothetical protein
LTVWNLDKFLFTKQAKDNQQNENNHKNLITKISKSSKEIFINCATVSMKTNKRLGFF